MIRRLLPLSALVLGLPGTASGLDLPEGCEAFLTVQSKGCSVSVLWSCEGAPEGDFTEASFGPDGLETLVSYAKGYQWLDTVYTWDSSREVLLPPADDPIDLPTLLETGIDTFDFAMRRSQPDRTYQIRVIGADELTGETTVIDGYTLDIVRTRLEITDENGTVEYQSEGTQLFSRALGRFFLGAEKVRFEDGEQAEYDTPPVDIIQPGEPGFAATVPLYGCPAIDAALGAPGAMAPEHRSAKETEDDQV